MKFCSRSVGPLNLLTYTTWGFPDCSVGKESTCHAGDPGSIPGSGRSPREGIGYPHQDSWASLVAQLVKNLPTMQKTWVRSPGWKDSLEKGKGIHPSVLAWRIPWTVLSWSQTRLSQFHSLIHVLFCLTHCYLKFVCIQVTNSVFMLVQNCSYIVFQVLLNSII